MKCVTCILTLLALAGGVASAAIIDTVESPTGNFATPAQGYLPGFWRDADQDWQWQHNPIGDPVGSAQLSIEAFDVDVPAEVDEILAYDAGAATWISLGPLTGSDDTWDYTHFAIDSPLFDDIADGLKIMIDIDTDELGYKVTLGKSLLTVNQVTSPDPDPIIPAPGALLLCGLGTAVIAWLNRHRSF